MGWQETWTKRKRDARGSHQCRPDRSERPKETEQLETAAMATLQQIGGALSANQREKEGENGAVDFGSSATAYDDGDRDETAKATASSGLARSEAAAKALSEDGACG